MGRTRATTRRFWTNSRSQTPSACSPIGFSMASTAPAPSASYVSDSSLRLCAAETIIIGVRTFAMMARVASKPDISGITASSETTSGRSASHISTASRPLVASPTTSMNGSLSMIEAR